MRDDLRQRLTGRSVKFYEVDSFDERLDGRRSIEQLDALYMTRIQKEHNNPSDAESMVTDRLLAILLDAASSWPA